MAPSSGHLLVPKVLKVVRLAINKTNEVIRSKLATAEASTKAKAQPIPVYAKNHPTHPLAYLKQARGQSNRWFSTQTRTFITATTKLSSAPRARQSKFSTSQINRTIRHNGASPFASTLRPNLTGGTLPRTAGGYSLGGAGRARHFSHTPGCQARIVHNVSAGIRGFVVGGGKVGYDGVDPVTGEKRFSRITATQEKAYTCFEHSKASSRGTSLEFKISPTITALAPAVLKDSTTTLQTPELLSTLSADFARSLQSLSQILNDLKRLSELGELPISLVETDEGPVLSVRFLGCDADIVNRLCDEVGVTRGIVREDAAWQDDKEVQMALLFPFAPSKTDKASSDWDAYEYFYQHYPLEDEVVKEQRDWQHLDETLHGAPLAEHEDDFSFDDAIYHSQPMRSGSPSGYESLEEPHAWTPSPRSNWKSRSAAPSGTQDFEGVEGIYRFIRLCDQAGR